jgi:hypothetical protein
MTRSSARVLIFVVILITTFPPSARADFFAVPFAGMKFGGSTSIADFELAAGKKKFVLGASARWVGDGVLGFEVEFANMAGFFSNQDFAAIDGGPHTPLVKPGSYVNDLTGSIILSLPPGFTGGGLRPYAVVGGGLIQARTEDIFEVILVRRTVPAINLGIGAVGMFTNNVGVRFDVRHLRSLSTDPPTGGVGHHIAYSRFTIGLLLRP